MSLRILGVSGSATPNSNIDRAVNAVLKASKLESDFVKLSNLNIRPCRGCKQCVDDNICKQDDDFGLLCKKLLEADALVIGAYSSYGTMNGFTKAFMERLWSLRHVNNLLKDKQVVIIVNGIYPSKIIDKPILRYTGLSKLLKRKLPAEKTAKAIAFQLGTAENMNIIGKVILKGNVPCITCGNGDHCVGSGVKFIFGKNVKTSKDLCVSVEDQEREWLELQNLGNQLRNTLST